ncbi:hypothetical protein D1871_07100 [Nakamurella silvestris]|nr:hypothetical protein D1871_07100 [Nakamurella silvestris]
MVVGLGAALAFGSAVQAQAAAPPGAVDIAAARPAVPHGTAVAAVARVNVAWSFSSSRVSAGTPVRVSWNATGTPGGAKVSLERKTGSSWTTEARLTRGSGAVTVLAPKAGKHTYRVAVRSSSGRTLKTANKVLTVVGKAPAIGGFTIVKPRLDAGKTTEVRYKLARVPSGSTITLQRTMGTAKKWTDVTKLSNVAAGSVTITAPARGSYGYRILIIKSGVAVATSVTAKLYSYSNISWAELTGDSTQTVNVDGTLFRYVDYTQWEWHSFLRLDRTSCRRLDLQAVDVTSSSSAPVGNVSVTQESADPVTLTLPKNQIRSLSVALSGDALDISTGGSFDGYIYVNGSFNCYTADGTR